MGQKPVEVILLPSNWNNSDCSLLSSNWSNLDYFKGITSHTLAYSLWRNAHHTNAHHHRPRWFSQVGEFKVCVLMEMPLPRAVWELWLLSWTHWSQPVHQKPLSCSCEIDRSLPVLEVPKQEVQALQDLWQFTSLRFSKEESWRAVQIVY